MAVAWTAYDGRPFFRKARLELELRHIPDVRMREIGEQTQLAIPYSSAAPFPLAELFCFAALYRIEGKHFIVYTFDRKRNPVFPPIEKKTTILQNNVVQ